MVCTGFLQPLDLECLLVNTLSGSLTIFFGLAFATMMILAAKLKLPPIVIGVIFGIFIILTTAYFEGWLLIMIMIVGFGISYWVSKIVKQ